MEQKKEFKKPQLELISVGGQDIVTISYVPKPNGAKGLIRSWNLPTKPTPEP